MSATDQERLLQANESPFTQGDTSAIAQQAKQYYSKKRFRINNVSGFVIGCVLLTTLSSCLLGYDIGIWLVRGRGRGRRRRDGEKREEEEGWKGVH